MATSKRTTKRVMIDVDAEGKPVAAAPVIPQTKPVVTAKVAPGYFSRVVSNVKARPMDLQLGACTAVVSEKNRAGKTAVLDAFRLALTGKHPIGPDAVDLAGLAADGLLPSAGISGERATSTFTFPEGKRTPVLQTSGEFVELAAEEVGKLLPLVTNRDLLTLGTAKAREVLFRRFGGTALASAAAVPVGLSPEQVTLWQSAMTESSANPDVVERLGTAGTFIRSHKRSLSMNLKALEEEKQRLHEAAVAAGAGAPTDDLVLAIQKKIDTHKALATTTLLRSRAQFSESRLLMLVEQYKATPVPVSEEDHQRQLADLQQQGALNQLRMNVEAAEGRQAAAAKQVRLFTMLTGLRHHLKQANSCLVCTGTMPGNVEGLLQDAHAAVDAAMKQQAIEDSALAASRAELQAQLDARSAAEARLIREYRQVQDKHTQLVAELKSAKLSWEAAQEMLKEAGVAEVPSESLEVLQQQLEALQAAKAESGRATRLATQMRALVMAQEDTKTVEKELGKRLNDLVAAVRTEAQRAVNAWMPPGFTAALMLEDAEGKPACRWEIVGTDGRPHPRGAASGAEWAALTVAVACAWSEGQKYRFLLLDDTDLAGFSAENVRVALTMVSKAVTDGRLTQALVAWSRPQEIPETGWNVVTL